MNDIAKGLSPDTLEALVLSGDLGKLTQEQRLQYYVHRAMAAGLDPGTKPFDILPLGGKLILYATKECSAQLSALHKLSVEIISTGGCIDGIYQVTARASGPDGRKTDEIGAVSITGLKGDALCNAIMKAVTKAKRRAVLSHCGLGMLDESEIATIPGAAVAKSPTTTIIQSPSEETPFQRLAAATQQHALPSRPDPQPAPAQSEPEPPACTMSTKEPIYPDQGRMLKQDADGGTWAGIIQHCEQKTGKTNNKSWTRFGVHTREHGTFGTFDLSLGAIAKQAKDAKVPVEIDWTWKTGKDGNARMDLIRLRCTALTDDVANETAREASF